MTNLSMIFRAARRLAWAVVLTGLMASVAAPALAQDPIPPPQHSAVDANGVDLISGAMSVTSGLNSIGPSGPGGLSASKTLRAGFSISSMFSYVKLSGSAEVQETTLVAFMGRSQLFYGTPDIGPEFSEGNTLDKDANNIIYTLADGTVARFKLVHIQYVMNPNMRPAWGVLQSVTYPSGEKLTFTYDVETIGASWMKVESSLGYAIAGSGGMHEWDAGAAANLTQGGCSGTSCTGPTFASQEALGRAPTKSVSGTTVTITSPAGGTPKSYVVYADDTYPNGRVTSVTDGAGTWTYTYGQEWDQSSRPDEFINVVTVTDPLGNKRTVRSRNSTQNILSDKVGIKPDGTGGDTTTFQYSYDSIYPGLGVLNQITAPQGNRTRYVYDDRFNVIEKWNDPKPGSGLASTSITASYSIGPGSLCASIKVCNRPDWIKDERGAQTDFTYDPVHGGVLTATKPAGPNGIRPQTRYSYGQFTPRYIQNGVLTAAAPVWRLTQTSTCATLAGASGTTPAACAGTADETVTSYAYEPSNVANNVRLLSVTTRAGDNSLSATVANTYDARGDVVTVDGPLPGAADTTRTYYDASRWKIGEIGPDPDGSGALLYRATRTTYAADGQVTSVEAGTATNQSDTGMSTFASLQTAATAYDAQRRKSAASLVVDGVTQALSQYGYDTAGRSICQTVRMNPAAFASAPGACALGTQGADGPDRITFTEYDAASRVTKVTSGYGTSGSYAPRVEKTVTYTANGQEQTVADGKGNLTTYEYDGFDRLARVRYPNPTCCTSSTTDYEEYVYDPANNRASWRRRDGTTVAFTYDALNRANNGLRSETYAYDNLGRRTSATYGGGTVTATYDALGRMTGENTYDHPLTYQYDLAGRRTRMTWWDGFYVTYGYDASGTMTGIYEQGATQVAAYAYDNLGRRDYAWLGLGAQAVSEDYGYDAASRLASLTLDQAGTVQDQTWTFAYNAAGQVKTRTASNSFYEWSGSQTSKAYTVNGLNQYATVAGTSITYTLRGNLKSDGGRTYCYDLPNNLTGVWAGDVVCNASPPNPTASLAYEPTGRLWQVAAGSGSTAFIYSGSDLVAELDGVTGAILRRYVPGPGTDAPIAWYEGSGRADRRWLLADPQGSIVAVTNSAGALIGGVPNTYDEYGVPAAGNVGRFQYTGQIWIPEIGLYHYKARAYSPTLGRFLQTDPIGYKAGLNWYSYVRNDPTNRRDPTGLYTCEKGTSESDCKRIEEDMRNVRRAANVSGLNYADKARLNGVSKTYGALGDATNGVTVGVGSLSVGTLGQTLGKAVTLDYGQIDKATPSGGAARSAVAANAIAHEGQHVRDNISGYFDADRPYQIWYEKMEWSAYLTGYVVDKAFGFINPYSILTPQAAEAIGRDRGQSNCRRADHDDDPATICW